MVHLADVEAAGCYCVDGVNEVLLGPDHLDLLSPEPIIDLLSQVCALVR